MGDITLVCGFALSWFAVIFFFSFVKLQLKKKSFVVLLHKLTLFTLLENKKFNGVFVTRNKCICISGISSPFKAERSCYLKCRR